jgi:hypothetical protein
MGTSFEGALHFNRWPQNTLLINSPDLKIRSHVLANSCQQAENIEKSDGASTPPKLRLEEKMPLTHLRINDRYELLIISRKCC